MTSFQAANPPLPAPANALAPVYSKPPPIFVKTAHGGRKCPSLPRPLITMAGAHALSGRAPWLPCRTCVPFVTVPRGYHVGYTCPWFLCPFVTMSGIRALRFHALWLPCRAYVPVVAAPLGYHTEHTCPSCPCPLVTMPSLLALCFHAPWLPCRAYVPFFSMPCGYHGGVLDILTNHNLAPALKRRFQTIWHTPLTIWHTPLTAPPPPSFRIRFSPTYF